MKNMLYCLRKLVYSFKHLSYGVLNLLRCLQLTQLFTVYNLKFLELLPHIKHILFIVSRSLNMYVANHY